MSRRKDWTYRFSNTDNQQQKEDKFYTIDEAEEVDDSKSDLLENEDEMLQVYAQKAKRNSKAYMEDEIPNLITSRRKSQIVEEESEGISTKEEVFNQLLLGPSSAARRRRSSFALPIEESTGRPTLPIASKLTKAEPTRPPKLEEESKQDATLSLVANSFKSFKTDDRKLFKRMEKEAENVEAEASSLFGNLGNLEMDDTMPEEMNPFPSKQRKSSIRPTSAPDDHDSSPFSRSARGSLQPEDHGSVKVSPRVSLQPEEDTGTYKKLSLPGSSKLEDRVSFLKTLTESSKLETSPSFVTSSGAANRPVLTKRNTERFIQPRSLEESNEEITPMIFVDPIITPPVEEQVSEPVEVVEPVVAPVIQAKTKNTPGPKKKQTPIAKDLKKIVLDSRTLQQHPNEEWRDHEPHYPSTPGKSAFGKADTGRLRAIAKQKLEAHNSIEDVMLVGMKVKHKVPHCPPEKQHFDHEKEITVLEPFYSQPLHSKQEKEVEEVRVDLKSPGPVLPAASTEKEEVDVGFYNNINEVDAVMNHFTAILEERKRKLLEGQIDKEIITDTEVPSFLNQIRMSPVLKANTIDQLSEPSSNVPQVSETPKTEPVRPSTSQSRADSINSPRVSILLRNSNQSRPRTAGEVSTYSRSSRSIKSASNATPHSSNSRSVYSTCTCTCSTGSCSECQSRSNSANEFQSRASSAKTTSTVPQFRPLDFMRYGIEDPLGKVSLLDLPEAKKESLQKAPELIPVKSETDLFEEEQLPLKKNMNISGHKIYKSAKKLQESLSESLPVAEKLNPYHNPREGPISIETERSTFKKVAFGSITDFVIERVMSHKKLKETQLVAPKTDLLMDPVSYSIQNEQSGNIPFSIEEEQEPAKLERMDSLDLQVQNVVQQYELMKIQQEEKNRPRQRRRSSILMEQHRLKELVERTNEPDDSDYITEEESVEEDKSVKPLPSEGKRLWQIIRKDIQKKKLINSLKGSVELEHDLLVKQRRELESVLEKDEEENVGVSEVQIFVPKDGKPDPRAFYQMQRRQYDMEKFPDLYANIKINPVTNQLELSITKKPTIGISPEPDRAKMLADDDPDVVHQFYIRHGLQINGFTTSGQRNLYEIVHNIDRRKAGLSGMDRVKYPTFDDPGPPLDATGTPRLDDSMMEEEKQPDLSQEIQKLDVLINESTAPVPAYYRKRGILLARTGKYNRAMEDLDNAIQYDQFNSDGLWHRHQLYLRYNDGSSALADLDSLTENNKVHLGAFQAKARIYQALGMYKLATVNYGTVIRLKPDNPDAYFNRALLFEVDDEITFANEDYRAVRLLDPTNEVAIHNLAMYSFQKQLWSDCISEYSKLILFNPESADYYMFRGRAYASMSFYVEALEDLTQAIRINPDKSMYYFHRGCLLREQNIPKAIQDLSTSILLDDSIQNSDSYYYRAQLYQNIKQNDLAILDYLAAIALNPLKAKALLNLGILYMRHSKNFTESLNYINKAIAADPVGLRGYISRGELYEAMYRESMLKVGNGSVKRILRTTRLNDAAHYVGLAVKDYSRAIHIRPSNYILYLYRGKMLLKQGKVEEASSDFHIAFNLNASIAQTFIQRALILSFQRKHRQIIQEYDDRKKRLNLVTDEPALLLLVAKARIRDGDFQGALEDLNLASEQAVSNPQISLQKGICHEYLKNWYEASLEFSKCLERIPTFSKAYYHRGICKLAEGDDSGELDLNKAIELEPKYFDAYITRAAFFESKGLFGKAIADCDEALKIEPISIRAHILRGSSKCKIGLFPMAVNDFSKAISIDKNSHFAFYNRAIAYQASEDYVNAMKDYSIVLLLDDNVDAYRNRALLYWKLGDDSNALADFMEAKNLAPENAKIRCLYALGLHKVGRLEESVKEYTNAMELDGKLIEAVLGRGNVYGQLGELEKSRCDYCRVIHMYPRHADTLVNIAYTYQASGNPKMAWKYYTMAFTVDPQCTSALEGRALVNLKMENAFAAYLDITRAIEIDPENAQFLTNRGVIFEALKDNVSALQSYNLAIKKDRTYSLAYFNAANHYLNQHHWAKAIDYYTKALEIDTQDHSSLMNRAIAYSMLKKYDEAIQDLLQTIELDGGSATAFFNLGYVYNCLGNAQEAEKAFEKVIELAPDDPLAYQCRAEARTKQFKWSQAMEDFEAQITAE